MKSLTNTWQIRAVQLDLARQQETLTEIKALMVFAKEWNYNTIFLYLEGVVQTTSFPWNKKPSYSPDEVRQMVDFATELGLEVIPCVSTLGHAEHFLHCQELADLGETGFWHKDMFCPSNEHVYSFLSEYLSEIASFFPSTHFHIGCDEAWALGACPKCHKRMLNGESREDLLIEHILRIRKILSTLGKRVWIWDDAFENTSPKKLESLPRDIVLCAWHYNPEQISRDGFQGHFNNLRRLDKFSLYQQLGFDMIVCPNAKGVERIFAYADVSADKQVFGGILTIWELSNAFLTGLFPTIALQGALWANLDADPDALWETTLKKLFSNAHPHEIAIIANTLEEPLWLILPVKNYLRGNLTMEEVRYFNACHAYAMVITEYLKRLPESQERDMLEQLEVFLRLQILAGKQRKTFPQLIDPRVPSKRQAWIQQQAWECVNEMGVLAQQRATQWKKFRSGEDAASRYLYSLQRNLHNFIDETRQQPEETQSVLYIRLVLVDSFSAPKLTLRLHDGTQWHEVFSGTHKPVNYRDAQYYLQLPIQWEGKPPSRLQISVSGYGGQGISYAWLVFSKRRFVPKIVFEKTGNISRANALLTDNSTFCFLGNDDTVKTINLFRHNDESSVEILLHEEKILL